MSGFNHGEFELFDGTINGDTESAILEAVKYNSAYLAIGVTVMEGAQTLQPLLRLHSNVFEVDGAKNIDFVAGGAIISAPGDYLFLINSKRDATPDVDDKLENPIPRRFSFEWEVTTAEDATFKAWLHPIITPGS